MATVLFPSNVFLPPPPPTVRQRLPPASFLHWAAWHARHGVEEVQSEAVRSWLDGGGEEVCMPPKDEVSPAWANFFLSSSSPGNVHNKKGRVFFPEVSCQPVRALSLPAVSMSNIQVLPGGCFRLLFVIMGGAASSQMPSFLFFFFCMQIRKRSEGGLRCSAYQPCHEVRGLPLLPPQPS